MDETDPSRFRASYAGTPLRRDELHAHPMEQFRVWFAEALAAGLPEPNAMVLATADAAGVPRARTVLLKGHSEEGLRFFTSYLSRKARELAANPRAGAVFPWHGMRRQVIVSGAVEPLTSGENDAYFATRPRGSQLGAWASGRQSEPLSGRAELLRHFDEYRRRWGETEPVPRPEYWGGYLLRPVEVEFWQGQADRLHDRFIYRRSPDNGDQGGGREEESWQVARLSP